MNEIKKVKSYTITKVDETVYTISQILRITYKKETSWETICALELAILRLLVDIKLSNQETEERAK